MRSARVSVELLLGGLVTVPAVLFPPWTRVTTIASSPYGSVQRIETAWAPLWAPPGPDFTLVLGLWMPQLLVAAAMSWALWRTWRRFSGG